MYDRTLFLLCCLATLPCTPLSAQALTSTAEVSAHYMALDLSRQYDALASVYAPDATFLDPTGEVFTGPVAEGLVTGAATIIAMQKSWGLAHSAFMPDAQFVVGEYAVYRGTYQAGYQGSDAVFSFPFITIHRVEDGRLTERLDFGSYIEAFGLGDGFDDATASTRAVADRYLQAYLERDFTKQATLMAPDVMFQDPTAQLFGPPYGELYAGLEQVIARRKATFQTITAFGFEVEASFAANHHAVYMGTTTYTLADGQRFAQPAIFVIEVREGNVTRHWDFVDYTTGPLNK